MHVIIRLGNGDYYVSAVFGVYNAAKNKASDTGHSLYYIVFDQNKQKLVKKYLYDQKALKGKGHLLHLMVLDLNYTREHWNLDEDGYGCVEFLNKDDIEKYLSGQALPDDILSQCRAIDDSFEYQEWNEIKTAEDVEQLDAVSWGFHDASIDRIEQRTDGSLYVLFNGLWGCDIEVVFKDEVSYCTESRNPETSDPYWFGSTILFDGEFKILIDDEDLTLEDISDGYCWFKAKKMSYHVIPH